MIALEEAQARVMALAKLVEAETVPLAAAINRYAATDLTALRTQPARDLSAMDGYAICADAMLGPWRIIGESAAGAPFARHVAASEAVRIFTGAVMPKGSNAVIMQEDMARENSHLSLVSDIKITIGKHVRAAGSDFAEGNVIVPQGTRLSPAQIGLLALAGHSQIPVARHIKVAILSTGDELLPLGAACDDHHIPASNAIMLVAMLAGMPADVHDLGIIPDDLAAITSAIQSAHEADILVTIGGASVGDHDLVRPSLLAAGAQIDFWKVAMKPGKPLMAGTLNKQIILGLPGNPVSAYVTALLFLKPLIAALTGTDNPLPSRISLQLGAPLPANGNRSDHIRAQLREGRVFPLASQDSAGLFALSQADALIVRAPDTRPAQVGDIVDVILT